jgi:hypothetical protein
MIAAREPGLDERLVAGVDVGGTKTSVVVTDGRDRVLYERIAPTDPAALVDQIAGLVDEARRELGQDIVAVGVAIPGNVDPEDGSVSMAVNLGITHLPLGPMLEAELAVPTFVEHDARAAAVWLSEQATNGSSGRPPASVAFLAIGTGISAGVVLDGAVLRGDNSFAGEVGHVVADPDGALCACGLRGCLETIAAGPRSAARPTRRWPPVEAPSVVELERRGRVPRRLRRRRRRASRSRIVSPTTWPARSGRWPSPSASSGSSSVAASRPPDPPCSNPSERASPANGQPRRWSRPPWVMRPSSSCRRPRRPAPVARQRSLGSRIGLPEGEGVGGR